MGRQPSDPVPVSPWIGQRTHAVLLPIAPINPPASILSSCSNATTRRRCVASRPPPASAAGSHHLVLHRITGKSPASAPLQHTLHHISDRRRRALHCNTELCIATPIDDGEHCIAALEPPTGAPLQHQALASQFPEPSATAASQHWESPAPVRGRDPPLQPRWLPFQQSASSAAAQQLPIAAPCPCRRVEAILLLCNSG